MKTEVEKVRELTGAEYEQIRLQDDGYSSRAYIVNDCEMIVKFPKQENVDYKKEAFILNELNKHNMPVRLQKVKYISDDGRLIVLYGVKGTPLKKLTELTDIEKQKIAKQMGLFIKKLHSLKIEVGGENLEDELANYKIIYDELSGFYKKYFASAEQKMLNDLIYNYLPSERRKLGERLVFCHADLFENNVIIDSDCSVGIIDCANAGYYDEAADFDIGTGFCDLVLDSYGASETLRKKVVLKNDITIFGMPKYHIDMHGEAAAAEKWVPIMRKTLLKYKEQLTEQNNGGVPKWS